jgi:para-nitrobenzyl esterase
MHAAWIRFAATGDPGWQAFDASYPVMTFGRPEGSALVLDPRGDERTSWPAADAG